MRTYVFWDVDGTLLSTSRAGIYAWEHALFELHGVRLDLAELETAGLTDYQVAAKVLALVDLDDAALIPRLVRCYERLLPTRLACRVGKVMPNVVAILEAAAARDDVHSFLLTGNTREGAWAKLAHYGLRKYFDDGGFCEDTGDRSSIARVAIARALDRHGALPNERFFVVGDTPHDIACGHAVGARVIAVATGAYGTEELQRHRPWWTTEELPAPEVFFGRLGLTHTIAEL